MRLALCAPLCGLLLAIPFAHANGGNKDEEARARLKTLNDETDLQAMGLKPWYLKLEVQMYRQPGPDAAPGMGATPGELGTVEEWWASPTQYRIVYSTPTYHAEEGANAAGRFRSAGWTEVPDQLELARRQVVHPLPTEAEAANQTLELRRQDFGTGPFDCLIVGRPVLHVPFPPIGTFPTFCTRAGSSELAVTIDDGREFLPRILPAMFQGRKTVTGVVGKINGQDAVKAKVETLGEIAPRDADFAAPANAEKIAGGEPVAVPAAEMKAALLHKESPRTDYGDRRPNGVYTARVLIGTDGKVLYVRTVSGVGPIVAESERAIRGYVYKPWLVSGQPNEVLTTVSVEY